ncbi:MAG: hypothetical protein FJW92_04220 [Actinobacteria bacterium]|nr:hypothetical protein [Actinomycetota bacterium]
MAMLIACARVRARSFCMADSMIRRTSAAVVLRSSATSCRLSPRASRLTTRRSSAYSTRAVPAAATTRAGSSTFLSGISSSSRPSGSPVTLGLMKIDRCSPGATLAVASNSVSTGVPFDLSTAKRPTVPPRARKPDHTSSGNGRYSRIVMSSMRRVRSVARS